MNGVAITGMWVISSAGTNLENFWKILESGTITYKEIEEYKEDKNYRTKIGARIEDDIWQAIIYQTNISACMAGLLNTACLRLHQRLKTRILTLKSCHTCG